MSHEDNNDVVSNYFSKKQKGVGLLSVFNKVADLLVLLLNPLFIPQLITDKRTV